MSFILCSGHQSTLMGFIKCSKLSLRMCNTASTNIYHTNLLKPIHYCYSNIIVSPVAVEATMIVMFRQLIQWTKFLPKFPSKNSNLTSWQLIFSESEIRVSEFRESWMQRKTISTSSNVEKCLSPLNSLWVLFHYSGLCRSSLLSGGITI